MPKNPVHEELYSDLLTNGDFDSGGKKQNHVCLTRRHSQKARNRSNKRRCFILYGPGKNYDRQLGAVHIRRDFWSDAGKMNEKGVKFHEDVYALFHLVHHLLEYQKSSSDEYGKLNGQDWLWFDVENWEQFSAIVRKFNNGD